MLNDFRGESDREKLVVDLYKNQNKNIRDIAKELRMSFRDIDLILKGNGSSRGIVTIDNKRSSNNNEKTTSLQTL
jgi:DNA-binding transcriptional regulator LsrR (DeoR family)